MPNKPEIPQIALPHLTYYDLFKPEKLADLTAIFFDEVKAKSPDLFRRFDEYRAAKGAGLAPAEISRRIVEMASHLDGFVARLFGVQKDCEAIRERTRRDEILFTFKKEFFIRRALKKVRREEALGADLEMLDRIAAAICASCGEPPAADEELAAASAVMDLLARERALRGNPDPATLMSLRRLADRLRASDVPGEILPSGEDHEALRKFIAGLTSAMERWLVAHYYRRTERMRAWAVFKVPRPLDYQDLVEVRMTADEIPPKAIGPEEHYRARDGFDLTDERFGGREIMSEVDYCILCHERDKDSCSKGIRANGEYARNPLGYTLQGCPLDQKISESHLLKGRGEVIGALGIIAIDNPMCPGTGHRICNDCMKACIYQKQDPVNIPQVETGILTDVLALPWGFEIYSLLTRWNPLNIHLPHPLPYNGKKILIVGMGPAGYTLAHYFLNAGFGVVGIDGLKIEPLPADLVGSEGAPFHPVRDIASIRRPLSERVLSGFGGVSEYGITVRWDKNFLTVIYLNLLRREHFRLYDGVRFGGTITLEDAWDLGFDHVCLAAGAGKPTFVSTRNNLIRGVRMASDFLMALQLTGAGKRQSMANLQIRLPAIVIGGGLTAIDTATELMAYYPVQVEKIKHRYERLCERYGKSSMDAMFTEEERDILRTFLDHADAIGEERERARQAGTKPDFIRLIRAWGGVSIYYRKSMIDSPAYRLNHEEIIKSLEEGISFVERMSPVEAVPDRYGALEGMVFRQMVQAGGKWKESDDLVRVPARSLLVAAGTAPNVMYEREHPGTFELDERDEFFASYAVKGSDAGSLRLEKAPENEIGFFTSAQANGRFVSYYGDNHPDFEGNVVKAMASAKYGFRKVLELFPGYDRPSGTEGETSWRRFAGRLDEELRPVVVRVDRLTPTIVEVIIRAPRAARKFQPGQFYRLQNYEIDSPLADGTLLMMEGLALTGAWVDKEKGLLSLIVLEFGASTRMCSMLTPGQRVVVMGPTGAPTELTDNATVLLLGGGLGNAVLFSIAKAFKERNNRVIYFAGYKKAEDLFKREEIEVATDVVVYSVDQGLPIPTRRPSDRTFVGNIVQAMQAYASGQLGEVGIPLRDASRVIAIGSDRMMAAVADARHTILKPYLKESHVGIASINSPMQCMMKAVCAQCVQRHVLPGTKEEMFVFTCFNQDQKMDEVDFSNLSSRLRANSLMEKISNRWLDLIMEQYSPAHV